jgi:hypothetical protein
MVMNQWQYNGVDKWWRIIQWCEDTFGPDGNDKTWRWSHDTIYFKTEKEYTVFLLRWS